MCHIVHVGRPNATNLHNTAYGEVAMQDMFDRLVGIGIPPQRCQAYVYGGGNMFPQMFTTTHVGANNARWVMDFLHDHGIVVVGESLGGTGYRKVSWTVGRDVPVVETVQSTWASQYQRYVPRSYSNGYGAIGRWQTTGGRWPWEW